MDNIDRQIAEKIMGWTRVNPSLCWWDRKTEQPTKYLKTGWRPSTTIAHAFEVVEKMAKDGAELRMDYVDGNWLVWFYCNKTNKPLCAPDNKDHPKTPAMAICLATLETIKED